MKLTRRRQVLIGALLFLLGAASSAGGAAIVSDLQGGGSLGASQQAALQVAAQLDDQGLIAAAGAAHLALSANDHQLFSVAAINASGSIVGSYTDAVGAMRSSLNLGSDGPDPDWFYTCFNSTAQIMRGSARIFDAAAGLGAWSDSQTAVVRQTVDDLDTASQYVDLVVTGGKSVAPKASTRPGPNGFSSSEGQCGQIQGLADTLAQRAWPST